jgi:hypothetical protein
MDSLSVYADPNLFTKAVEFAIQPPIVVMLNKLKQPINSSFKEVADVTMNQLQKDTMKILVEDDNKIEKLRGGELIIMNSNNSTIADAPKFKQQATQIIQTTTQAVQKNGPIDIKDFQLFSFLETQAIPGMASMNRPAPEAFTKPISVKMKLPNEPDPQIKTKINQLEANRVIHEMNLCRNAKIEFQLITEISIKTLQKNLEQELIPYFVIGENSMVGIKEVIGSTVLSHPTPARFLEIDNEKISKTFPGYSNADPVAFNKEIYSKILNLFTENQSELLAKPEDTTSNTNHIVNNIPMNNIPVSNTSNIPVNNFLNHAQSVIEEHKQNNPLETKLNKAIPFDIQKCQELAQQFKNLNLDCNKIKSDKEALSSYLTSSFLQLAPGPNAANNNNDFINVKFSSADESYPTIEKLISQMMARRDLAEKFLRLKILKYQSDLQKAVNEMIQDNLHVGLHKVIAKYGPTIEGLQEHIKTNI